MPLPAASQNTNWRTSDLNVPPPATRCPPRLKRSERTPVAEGGIMGEKLPKVANSTSFLGSFTCRKLTTWDRRLYFPSEKRRVEDFFVPKIRRLRPDLNPRTWVPEASTLTSRPPKPLRISWCIPNSTFTHTLRVCNSYCYSNATMIEIKHFNVSL